MKALPIMPEQEVTHAQHMCLFVLLLFIYSIFFYWVTAQNAAAVRGEKEHLNRASTEVITESFIFVKNNV